MKNYIQSLDDDDPFQSLRDEFAFPEEPIVYLNGNSLGPQPQKAKTLLMKELEYWQTYLVKAQLHISRPWVTYHEDLSMRLAKFLGTKSSQLMIMNALTVNLHLALISFYQPTRERYKIIYIKGFPSDVYALESQIQQRLTTLKPFLNEIPFDKNQALISIEYDENYYISYEKIENVLRQHGNETVLFMFEAIHYQTGQAFDIKKIAGMAAKYGVLVGVDFAHMIGNMPVHLNDLNIDFAVWCHYKYMNAGPGAIGGFYVHEKHLAQAHLTKLHGWWGVPVEKRFNMSHEFVEAQDAQAWAISNANIFSLCILDASLEIFEKINMQECFQKSLRLGEYFKKLVHQELMDEITIITPVERGCQVSIKVNRPIDLEILEQKLYQKHIFCDCRPPILRLAFNGLYNTFQDVDRVVKELKTILCP
jgi:kynureninase